MLIETYWQEVILWAIGVNFKLQIALKMQKGISLFEWKAEYKCIFLTDNAMYKLCVLSSFWNQMEESLKKS